MCRGAGRQRGEKKKENEVQFPETKKNPMDEFLCVRRNKATYLLFLFVPCRGRRRRYRRLFYFFIFWFL
jgi:hypothetical protein